MNATSAKPTSCRRMIARLRDSNSRLVGIPLGILLVLGGIVGFLPIVGFWMLPLGLAILAAHIPFAARLHRKFMRAFARLRRFYRRNTNSR
jgi:hypothetical protein